jgi:DNA-binding GntR family transcriptional regulator
MRALERTPLRQQAYQQIKQQIVSLALPPGTVINETRLIETLRLGRTPIREALQRLALEKLVTIVPRRGIYVSEIGIRDLQQLFEVRLVLESMAARWAARRGTTDQWHHMEKVLNRGAAQETVLDNEALIAIDEACHHVIYEAAGNEFLQDTLVTIYALSLRLWYFFLAQIGDMQGAVLEHKRILKALKAGDENEAARLMEKHIRAFQGELQSVMLGKPV